MNIQSGNSAAGLLALLLMASPLPAQQSTEPAQSAPAPAASEPAQSAPAAAASEPAQSAPEAAASTAAASQQTVSASGYSKIRIVRLSEVKGDVKLDRNTGHGFETAMANLPIIEQGRLQTGTGVAEVEFEDNSSLRITPNSLVEFPRLELLPTGAKASTVKLLKGTAYVSLANTKGNDFVLLVGPDKLHLPPSGHVRVEMEPNAAKVAVMDGTAQVEGPSGTTEVGKKKTLTLNLLDQAPPVVAKNVEPNDFDSWDHNSADYHKRFASMSALGNSPYNYGVSDLMYYGNFVNMGGCGTMWRPYLASAAWDPYSNGAWAWYPSSGYSWVSPYPWGWMPYHYGSWSYCQGAGWGWQPGGSWNGLNNMAMVAGAGNGGGGIAVTKRQPLRFPTPPAGRPAAGQSTLVPVNMRPLAPSTMSTSDSFVFRNDSAGLGVPRGNLGNLNKVSAEAAQHGTVSKPVYAAVPASGQGNAAQGPAGQGGARSVSNAGLNSPIHAGSAPANRGTMNQGTMNQGTMNQGGLSAGSRGPMSPGNGSGSMGTASRSTSAPSMGGSRPR